MGWAPRFTGRAGRRAIANAPGERVGCEEQQALTGGEGLGERLLLAPRPVLGVAEVDQRSMAPDLSRILVDRLAGRVGDRIAVALEKPNQRHIAAEELACARDTVVWPVV